MSNQAKNWQEGYYTVLVDGKIIAVSKIDTILYPIITLWAE